MATVHPLRTYRDEARLTQLQLAELVGVSRTTVARWESGARKPDRDLLPILSEKTGLPPQTLRPDLAKLMEAAE